MRQIKFRAWLLDRNDPNQILDEDGEATVYSMTYDLAFEEYAPINELLASVEHLMQFTGLLDKNGKEIFERDVVYADRNKKRYEIQIGAYDSEDDESDEHSHFGVHGKEMGEHWREEMGMSEKYVEVIGNIYENPELLEVKK